MILPPSSSLFASEVQYWRLDPAHWRRTLEAVLATGIKTVSTYVPWNVHELAPGSFDFDGHTDPRRNLIGYLDLVQELGLRLAYRPGPSGCHDLEGGGHPRRIVNGSEAMLVRQADGSLLPGHSGDHPPSWQPCLLHPEYLHEVAIWFAAVDAVASEYTVAKGGPIFTCALDNELSYMSQGTMFSCDYNDTIVGPGGYWHDWLRNNYEHAAELPYAVDYDDLRSVQPPRSIGSDLESNLQWYFDWIRCKEQMLCDYLATLRGIHDDVGLSGVTYYTNLKPHRPEGVLANFHRLGRAIDGLVGCNFYRGDGISYSAYSAMARVLKLMNATLPMSWSAEFMGGPGHVEMPSHRVSRSQTETLSLMAMANGCEAINWSMFHDHESWSDSPVSELGQRRENHEALRHVMRVLEQLSDSGSCRPYAELAIVYYRPWMWHCHIGNAALGDTSRLHLGKPSRWRSAAGAAVAEYESLFRVIQQAGYQTAAVDLYDAPRRLNEHKVVWLPSAAYIDIGAELLLREFVSRGGYLVISGPAPHHTTDGQPLNFLMLTEVTTAGRMIGPFFEVRVGRGRVYMTESHIAHSEPGHEDPATVASVHTILQALLGPPAVSVAYPPVLRPAPVDSDGDSGSSVAPTQVEAILHRGSHGWLLYLINLHARALTVTLTFRDALGSSLHSLSDREPSVYAITDRVAQVDIDRSSVRVFEIHSG